MKKNMGTFDRLLRIGFGIVALILAYWKGGGWMSWLLVIVGIFCFFEAAASWCLIHQLIGRNSCPIKKP
ncbi:MAG: DUF2892 domain-containing protein [Verrucomicrobia bacterium]|nr:DUF2892 domain-containing protein [Verrucomicrobiota bacterium]